MSHRIEDGMTKFQRYRARYRNRGMNSFISGFQTPQRRASPRRRRAKHACSGVPPKRKRRSISSRRSRTSILETGRPDHSRRQRRLR